MTYFFVRKKYESIKKKEKKKSENFSEILFYSFFFLLFRKIGICFGNRPIADFFHDQTIFLKDYELYIIGHSLPSWNRVNWFAPRAPRFWHR